jgi:hypothetical protein
LIPVSRISCVGARSEASGAGRWIGQRSGHLDPDRGVDLRQLVSEDGVDDDAGHLLHSAYVVPVALRHWFLFSL